MPLSTQSLSIMIILINPLHLRFQNPALQQGGSFLPSQRALGRLREQEWSLMTSLRYMLRKLNQGIEDSDKALNF